MGRGDLIALAAAAAAPLVLCASAGAAVPWRLLADGPTGGPPVPATKGYLALSLAAAGGQFGRRLTRAATRAVATVDFSRNAVVAVFGEFGCRDPLIRTSSLAQRGRTLTVSLVERAPPPGTVQCMAIFATYRLLVVPKASLARPYPTRVAVSLARA